MNENKKKMGRLALGVVVVVGASFAGSWLEHAFADRAVGAPPLTYSGTALMGGVPIPDGMHNIGLTLHTRATGLVGVACGVTPTATMTTAGRFTIPLTDPACGSAIQQNNGLYVEISVDSTTLPRTQIGAVPYAVQAENGVPPGSIMPFASETAPAGWIVCDGRALDGDDAQYGALRAAIGTTWGTGTDDADGATDFNIPDLRGRFLRGFDDTASARDEDRDSRTASAPGGRTGSQIGTLQQDSFASHDHPVSIPWRQWEFNPAVGGGTARQWHMPFTDGMVGERTYGAARGGSETRPENASVLYIIKL